MNHFLNFASIPAVLVLFLQAGGLNALRIPSRIVPTRSRLCPHLSTTDLDQPSIGSAGVEVLKDYLNSANAQALTKKLVLNDKKLKEESEKANFWFGGSFLVKGCQCTGIVENGILFKADCTIHDKPAARNVLVPFPHPVTDEYMLKRTLVEMAVEAGNVKDTADIAKLPFGEDTSIPVDLRFNEVPHQTWVRSYLYDAAKTAMRRAINDETIPSKSRLQLKVNFPEVNPAFDTYRIGTILEMIRETVLALVLEEGKRVRVCVQQSLGEGVFCGLPLALSSMRPVMERMDWGSELTPEQKYQPGDVKNPRKEAMIRFGTVGADQVAEDDDVIIVIAPQNVVGGMIIELLDEMVKAAGGRPVIIINPNLADRPSSNNMMQIRGRSERRAIEQSFTDIFTIRLLYPSSGGYMFPIRGLVVKKDYRSLWVVYSRETNEKGQEVYSCIGAFPPHPAPSQDAISKLFTD